MSSASSANGLLNHMAMAEKELALYAAIIGGKPKIESAEAAPVEQSGPVAEQPIEEPASEVDHEPRKISLWMRHVSHEARRRFDEAKMRLAS